MRKHDDDNMFSAIFRRLDDKSLKRFDNPVVGPIADLVIESVVIIFVLIVIYEAFAGFFG